MGAGCNHIDHVNTQMPYAIFTAVITIIVFGYIPAGLGLPIYSITSGNSCYIFVGIQIIGKKVDEAEIELVE